MARGDFADDGDADLRLDWFRDRGFKARETARRFCRPELADREDREPDGPDLPADPMVRARLQLRFVESGPRLPKRLTAKRFYRAFRSWYARQLKNECPHDSRGDHDD